MLLYLELLVTAVVLGAMVFQVFWYTRNKRSMSELRVAEPPAQGASATPPPAADDPHAFRPVWIVVGVFGFGTLLLIVTQVVGALRPDLLRFPIGMLFARGIWPDIAGWLATFSFAVFISVVTGVRMRRRGRREVSSLNVALPQGWAIACVGSLVVLVGLLMLALSWNPPATGYAGVDAAGNHYALRGDYLIRWDAKGTRTLEVDVGAKPFEVSLAEHLSIAPSGDIVLADAYDGELVLVSPKGAFVATVAIPVDRFATDSKWVRTPISVEARDDGLYTLSGGEVWRLDRSGRKECVFSDPECRWAEDIAVADDGTIVLADPGNGRLVSVADKQATDLEFLQWSGDYRYPDTVKLAADGTIYVVVRKPWQSTSNLHLPGLRYGPDERPNTWMGELYAIRSGEARHVAMKAHGMDLALFDATPLPDGRIEIMPLNLEGLYVGRPGDAEFSPLDAGDMGTTFRDADWQVRLKSVAPQVLGGLAVVVPLLLGVVGASSAARRGRSLLPGPAGPPAPAAGVATAPTSFAGGAAEAAAPWGMAAPPAPDTARALGEDTAEPAPYASASRPERTITSAGTTSRRNARMMFFPLAIMALGMLPMIWMAITWDAPWAIKGMMLLTVLPTLLVGGILVWLSRNLSKPTVFVSSDEGLSTGKSVTYWDSVAALVVQRTSYSSPGPGIMLGSGVSPAGGAQGMRLDPSDLGLTALREMLDELVHRIDPKVTDPSLLVWRDFAEGSAAAIETGTLGPKTIKALHWVHLPTVATALERERKRQPSAALDLLVAQTYYLLGRARKAHRICQPLADSPTASPGMLLCDALASFALKDATRAAALLGRMPSAEGDDAVRAFRARMLEPGARIMPGQAGKTSVLGWVLVGAVIAYLLLEIATLFAQR